MEDTKDQIAGTPPQKEYYILIVYKQTKTGKSVTGISATNSNQVLVILYNDISEKNYNDYISNASSAISAVISGGNKRTDTNNINGTFCNGITGTTTPNRTLTSYPEYTIYYTPQIREITNNNTPSKNYISVNPLTPDKMFVNINTKQGITINNDQRTSEMMFVNINFGTGNSTYIEQLIPVSKLTGINCNLQNPISIIPMQKS